MSEKVKYLAFFFVFIFFVRCSLDKKSGLWTGSKDEKKRIFFTEERLVLNFLVKISKAINRIVFSFSFFKKDFFQDSYTNLPSSQDLRRF